MRLVCVNGTFEYRKLEWMAMQKSIPFRGTLFMLGVGAQGTMVMYALGKVLSSPLRIVAIDENYARERACLDVQAKIGVEINFVPRKVDESSYATLLDQLAEGDLVVDCSVGIDTAQVASFCLERGAMFINSAIEDWICDPFALSPNLIDESMVAMHTSLSRSLSSAYRGCALVSMGCNPGSVSVWLKVGLEWLAHERLGGMGDMSYAEVAYTLGVETIHISECDTQTTRYLRPAGEYWNTWSTDGRAFYKEGVGPGEIGFGTVETIRNEQMFLPGGVTEGYRVFAWPGFEMMCKTMLPLGGVYRGYMVRHDENYTLSRFLATDSYRPSVYYVYSPSDAAIESVEELRKTGEAQTRWKLMTDDIVQGRDEVGLTLFMRDGTCLFVGSELDIDEARLLFDHEMDPYVNATINQVVGGYVAGVAWLLANQASRDKVVGLAEPEVVSSSLGMKYGSPFWGPVCVCLMDSFARGNSLDELGVSFGRSYRAFSERQ